jgi:ferredoxin
MIRIGREEIPMKVTVDRDKCVASGQCVLAAAEVFDQNEEDGVVILLNEAPSPDQYDAVRLAAQMCPASVIEVTES